MSGVFVDTGAWIALFRRDDAHHEAASSFYGTALDDGALLVTSNYVTDETATRLRYDIGLPAALRFHDSMEAAVSARRLRLAWVDQAIEREAWGTMERFADVGLSLTDATSAVLARRAKIQHMFGFDADFRALGFDVQPA
jgi:uncharacterized protein